MAKTNGGRIDVIKYNINGAEDASLKGALKTITRFRPIIAIVMFEEAYHDFAALNGFLAPHRYIAHSIADGRLRMLSGTEIPHNNVVFLPEEKLPVVLAAFDQAELCADRK